MERVPVDELPDALTDADLAGRLAEHPFAVFLDYDGTLTPIVARPELATFAPSTRRALEELARHTVVGILSGRDLADVRAMVDAEGVWYAGSHGFDIAAPDGTSVEVDTGGDARESLRAGADELDAAVRSVPGAWVERKRHAVALHFRQVADASVPALEAAVDRVVAAHPGLRKTGGKRILELRPDLDWDKGRALWELFDRAGLRRGAVVPVFVGDDLTDEDAFAALADDGVGIVVADDVRETAARYRLRDPDEVRELLDLLVGLAR